MLFAGNARTYPSNFLLGQELTTQASGLPQVTNRFPGINGLLR